MIKFDSNYDCSYGYWTCPECKKQFYGGGAPLHEDDCTRSSELVYTFGPKENIFLSPLVYVDKIESILENVKP